MSWKPLTALIVPVIAKLPTVPASVSVKRVFGAPSASLILKTPLVPAVARVITGALSDSVNGAAEEKVFVFVNIFA